MNGDDLDTSQRSNTGQLDDLIGEFGEASAPHADLDEFDLEMTSSTQPPSDGLSEASSVTTGSMSTHTEDPSDPAAAYNYPMRFEMIDESSDHHDDTLPVGPIKTTRSLSFGSAEIIEYEQVQIKDEDLIGKADGVEEDDEDDLDEDDDVEVHFPAGAADDYRPPNRDHLINQQTHDGFDDPFESHSHISEEEDSPPSSPNQKTKEEAICGAGIQEPLSDPFGGAVCHSPIDSPLDEHGIVSYENDYMGTREEETLDPYAELGAGQAANHIVTDHINGHSVPATHTSQETLIFVSTLLLISLCCH